MLNNGFNIYVINYYKGLINVRVAPEIAILNGKKDTY